MKKFFYAQGQRWAANNPRPLDDIDALTTRYRDLDKAATMIYRSVYGSIKILSRDLSINNYFRAITAREAFIKGATDHG